MTAAPVSIVVVSRDRPRMLRRCVTGLGQLDYPNFEIIVVADPEGIEAVKAGGQSHRFKMVAYDQANIAAARNLGLAVAAGQVVAFIDDDAVPEPTWLTHLVAPIAARQAVCAGGFVLGRNGISWQWRARNVRVTGDCESLDVETSEPLLVQTNPEEGVKTEGTNMAFDRDWLAAVGGFDPAFQFYLDETDLNMRAAKRGVVSAIVPNAVVHHAYGASVRRRKDRTPLSLFQIGRSLMIYLRKHCPEDRWQQVIDSERDRQKRRALRQMVEGRVEPGDIGLLLRSFDEGLTEGATARIVDLPPLGPAASPFLRYDRPVPMTGHVALVARWYNLHKILASARDALAKGQRVTIFHYSLTIGFHRIFFGDDGIWYQKGGLFGRSTRQGPLFQFWSKKSRTAFELHRIQAFRPYQ